MATASRSTTSGSDASKASDTKDSAPGRVAPVDGVDHGYVGQVHPEKNNEDYTVAGVTGGTGKASDKPSGSSVDARAAWAPLQKS